MAGFALQSNPPLNPVFPLTHERRFPPYHTSRRTHTDVDEQTEAERKTAKGAPNVIALGGAARFGGRFPRTERPSVCAPPAPGTYPSAYPMVRDHRRSAAGRQKGEVTFQESHN
ncbi:unnamed protein product [Haemonchus placei]|uniref:Uncharacterized protein n=1 Tax=Haemonchus placei TaxID=6290 RepID=A0A0N4WY30_HAEPC|nr:unnamed protein product [Haemonchus placei]